METKKLRIHAIIGLSLAVITAIAYVLISMQALPVGNIDGNKEGGNIIFVAAGCYLLGGLLILTRKNWLLIIGAIINALVMTFFFSMYRSNLTVVFSAGGLATKIPQILLEIILIEIIVIQSIQKGKKKGNDHLIVNG